MIDANGSTPRQVGKISLSVHDCQECQAHIARLREQIAKLRQELGLAPMPPDTTVGIL